MAIEPAGAICSPMSAISGRLHGMATYDAEPGRLGGTPERPARFFTGPDEFAAWLDAHHDTATELWMGLRKKHVAERGLTWQDAVVEALRWGWIDSMAQRIDDEAVRQRWTPRRRGSNWSRINIETVERLKAEGRMRPSGLAAYEQRRPDPAGYSYETDGEPALPDGYATRLVADPAAAAFWEAATASYRRICVTWVMSAKQQVTRDRRFDLLLADQPRAG